MPEKRTLERARRDREAGKPPTTQAGEFVREEMEHVKEGKHGAKSKRQAVAIGLSKARRAGVDLPPPERGRVRAKTAQSAQSAYRAGQKSGPLKKEKGAGAGKAPASKARAGTKAGRAKAKAKSPAPRRKR